VGLKNGIHYFNYEVEDDFFGQFEDTLVQRGKVFVDVALDRRNRLMALTFDIAGQVFTECDRCLAAVDMPIHGHHKLYVNLGHAEGDMDDDDVVILSPDETHIDLVQHIYEFTLLSLPLQRDCSELPEAVRPCDEEVIRKLAGESLSDAQTDPTPPVDPRWDALKSLEDES
jgi:uncharacterized metal-binding protein YceD (DUF177 family)